MPIDLHACQEKERELLQLFASCQTSEERFEKIILLGRKAPSLDSSLWKEEERVIGCQSLMYLQSHFKEGKIYFSLGSDALLSRGLATVLLFVYNKQSPLAILSHPPLFIEKLKIQEGLTPGRSNGLQSLYQEIRKRALEAVKQL